MPFDSNHKPFDRDSVVENLHKTRAILEHEGLWCQGSWAKITLRDVVAGVEFEVSDGFVSNMSGLEELRRQSCLTDALHRVIHGVSYGQVTYRLNSDQATAYRDLFNARPEMTALAASLPKDWKQRPGMKPEQIVALMDEPPNAMTSLIFFNDSLMTSFGEIIELIDRAIVHAQENCHAI